MIEIAILAIVAGAATALAWWLLTDEDTDGPTSTEALAPKWTEKNDEHDRRN